MQVQNCGSCGHNQFFLREKGPNVGLYCSMCEKWQKWVSKKDLPTFKRQGFKVYPPDYVPDSLGVMTEPSFTPVPNPNGYDFDGQPSNKLFNAVQKHQQTASVATQSFHGADDFEPDEVEDEDNEAEYNHAGKLDCNTCLTGSMDVMSGLALISVLPADNLILVEDSTRTKLLASIEISYCPTCGRKL